MTVFRVHSAKMKMQNSPRVAKMLLQRVVLRETAISEWILVLKMIFYDRIWV